LHDTGYMLRGTV